MSSFAGALARIKGDLAQAVPAALIRRAADAVGYSGRDRVLTPAVTIHLALHRAFGSFAHLALLARRGLHGVFRLHQRRPAAAARDRITTYPKPRQRPGWMTAEEFDALPPSLTLREVRVRVRTPGRRVRALVLVTTLLDRHRYPARELARVYERRWQVEVNLRSLKVTLGMDVPRSKTADGVRKEVWVFGLAYNLVRRVMRAAAERQRVGADRISFVDTLRWLRRAALEEEVPVLVVHPPRPGRFDPWVRKRRPKQYPLMTRPRGVLKRELRQQLAA